MAVNTKDKYYTPDWLVEHTIKKAIEIIGKENIREIVEPSAGDGAFIEPLKKAFPDLKQRYYDLYPEHPEVIEQNYKEVRLTYKKGRLTIGNPPFGPSSSLWKAFCRKAATNSDYIVYISPASQYKSNYYFKEGELIYSELLNDVEYRGSETEGGKATKVRTCLNIYKVYDREEEEDWRLEKLEQDVHIFGANKDEIVDADFYLRAQANGGGFHCGEYDPERKYAGHLCVKVINKNLYEKIKDATIKYEDFLKDKGQRYLYKPAYTNYLKSILYPTREERLEQDVLIKIALFRNNEWRDKHILNEEYDLYVNTSYHINYIETCDFTKLTSNALVVKILNSTIKEKALTLIKKYIDDKHYVSEKSGYMSGFTVAMLKEYLISHLYPTREERLEQDVLINSDEPDYYITYWGDAGYVCKEKKCNCSWGIKLLNEDIKKRFEEIKDKIEPEVNKHPSLGRSGHGAKRITEVPMKEVLIKLLYPTREERLEQDVLIERDNKSNKYDFIIDRRGWNLGKLLDKPEGRSFYGIKVLNENMRTNIESAIKQLEIDFKIKAENDLRSLSMPEVKQQLIKHLYPTREERLEQDVLFIGYGKRFGKITKTSEETPDFYIKSHGSKSGEMTDEQITVNATGVKILNESIRNKVYEFFSTSQTKYIKDIDSSMPMFDYRKMKADLINYLYSDDPSFDSYDDIYPEVKKPIKIERAQFAMPLF